MTTILLVLIACDSQMNFYRDTGFLNVRFIWLYCVVRERLCVMYKGIKFSLIRSMNDILLLPSTNKSDRMLLLAFNSSICPWNVRITRTIFNFSKFTHVFNYNIKIFRAFFRNKILWWTKNDYPIN